MEPRNPAEGAAQEEAIHAVAARQHGVITRAQLLEIGLSARTVARRLAARRVRELHRGVYQVGPILTVYGRMMAAVLACGRGTFVSHFSAAVLWRLLREAKRGEAVDVTLRRGNRRRPGIRTHRVLALSREEVTKLERIPVTRPVRTLLDLASVATRRELERALARALAEDLTSTDEIDRLLVRHAGRRGAARLRALIGGTAAAPTRSEAEVRFLALVTKGGISAPEVNVRVRGTGSTVSGVRSGWSRKWTDSRITRR